MRGELRKVADRLGVLGCDIEQLQAWARSLVLRSAGTDSLPSIDLIVSSHTVAAETRTPLVDVIGCRALLPRRGLSSKALRPDGLHT